MGISVFSKTYLVPDLSIPSKDKAYPIPQLSLSPDADLIESARNQFASVKSYDEFIALQAKFLSGDLYASFSHFGPLYGETQPHRKSLIKMLKSGYITTGSQSGHVDEVDQSNPEHTCSHGFGYIEGYLHRDLLKDFALHLPDDIMMVSDGKHLIWRGEILETAPPGEYFTVNVLGVDHNRIRGPDDLSIRKHIRLWDLNPREMFEVNMKGIGKPVALFILQNFVPVKVFGTRVGDHAIIEQVADVL